MRSCKIKGCGNKYYAKGTVEITDLTEIGRSEVKRMCEQLIGDLEDINREEKD